MYPRRSAVELIEEIERRTRYLSAFALQRYLLRRRYVERPIYDYHLVLDAEDPGTGRELIRQGQHEVEQKAIVERMLKPGMVALDLGANMGYYTVMMARIVGSEGCIYAVEPHPDNFDLLRKNVALNAIAGHTELEQIAIGRKSGRHPLVLATHSNWHSLTVPTLDAGISWHGKYRRKIVGTVEVETRTLAEYLSGKRPIDFLRMDLEGYETEILRSIADQGARWAGRLHVLFETHPEFYDPRDNDIRGVLTALCERHGYQIKYLVSDHHFGWREYPDVEPGKKVFAEYGYGDDFIACQFRNRAVYTGIRTGHAIDLIATREQVKAALIAPAG